MSKKAAIFHGTDGKPDDCWLPWMRVILEDSGYSVFAPLLPNNHTPDKQVYEEFIKDSNWDFTDNILVGHSSGATTILNLLTADWFPNVSTVVLVGTFLNEKLTKSASWAEQGQFDGIFKDSYDPEVIRKKAKAFYFVHGSDDPYCDIDDARELCKEVGGTFIEVDKGHHLGSSSGFTQIPQLSEKLHQDQIL